MAPFTAPRPLESQDLSLTTVFEGLKNVAGSNPQDLSSFESVREFAVTSSPQDLSSESAMEIVKAFLDKLVDSLSGAWASINWHTVMTKVQQFAEASWQFIENANLLSPQKLTGYGLLVLSYYPILVVKPGMETLQLFFAIFSTIIELLGLTIIKLLGFTAEGVRLLSPASSFQSRNYGAFTPAGSSFSRLQSMGERRSAVVSDRDISAIETVLIALVRVVAGAAGIYLIIDGFVHPAA